MRHFAEKVTVHKIWDEEIFVRGLPPKVQVEDAKAGLLLKTRFKQTAWSWQSDACSNSHTGADPSMIWGHLGPSRLQNFPIHLLICVVAWKTEHFVHPLSFRHTLPARPRSKGQSWGCEDGKLGGLTWSCKNEAFAPDIPHKVTVEDVKTQLFMRDSLKKWKYTRCERKFSCDAPLQMSKIQLSNPRCLARLPPHLNSPWDHLTLISTESHRPSLWSSHPVLLCVHCCKWSTPVTMISVTPTAVTFVAVISTAVMPKDPVDRSIDF